ncbi:hypothetical protein AC249_AIPGENE10221 [Exaiptasia diaphana]|nr:hypothetical protein AC249_AIPGENE10221 [Exaiptasia diaphana]
MLISSLHELGKRQGIKAVRFDHSEPQSGKDICDRILCSLKASIKRYCNEGHDIENAEDMHVALKERPVNGTTATVCTIEEHNQTLEINTINNYSKLHNFKLTTNGIRVWKAFDIGPGKLLSIKDIVKCSQRATGIIEDVKAFPTNARTFGSKKVTEVTPEKRYQCSDSSCSEEFKTHSELDLHLNMYGHRTFSQTVKESMYYQIKKDWMHRFEVLKKSPGAECIADREKTSHPSLNMGWALHKKGICKRFPAKVRQYLIMKFNIGQQTGRKEDPAQVAKDMRTASSVEGERMFSRTEWLTKSQIQGFFSRLSKKIKEGQVLSEGDVESDSEETGDEDDMEEYACEKDEENLNDIRQAVLDKIETSEQHQGELFE